MNTEDPIQRLRDDVPRIPDPEALRNEVLTRIRMEAQVSPPARGLLDTISDLLAGWRMRTALAMTGTALLVLFTIQLIDVARAVHSIEQQYAQPYSPSARGIQALYTAEQEDLSGIHANAVNVLRDAGLDAIAMNGYIAIRKADLRPIRQHFSPFSNRRLQRLRVSGISPGELPSLLDELRSRVFLSLRFPV